MSDDHDDLRVNYGSQRQREIYIQGLAGESPAVPLRFEDLRNQAKEEMEESAFGYVAGGAGSESTMESNHHSFDQWEIRPRMLRDVSQRDLETSLLGSDIPAPILLAPVGVQTIIHDRGAEASAEAANNCGLPFVHSTVSSFTTERIAEVAEDIPLWFQLYWSAERGINKSFINRAEEAGYEALVVTVDTTLLGWRLRDLENSYLPFLEEEGLANYWNDPVFEEILGTSPSENPMEAIQLFIEIFSDPGLDWDEIDWIRDQTDLPVLIKGLLHPDDVRRARDLGVEGVIVSNHGGRQIDGEISALEALNTIATELDPDISLLFDSGIRTGSHVLKAIALGAEAVLVGRPYLYGLALDGESGVESVLKNIVGEFDLTMGLTGADSVKKLGKEFLVKK